MRNNFQVGEALGIKDHCTGRPAVAIIYDGDSVLCTFHGSRAQENANAVCEVIRGAMYPEYLDEAIK